MKTLKSNRLLVPGIIFALVFSLPVFSDSLWNDSSPSPYSTQKAYKIGDIVNVLVVENSSAKNLAGTSTNVKDDLSGKLTNTIQRLAPLLGTNSSVTGAVANKFDGTGNTSRGSNVTARIAAWVTDVQPNGNLSIKGIHKVEVNEEMQEITFTGMIRAKDISGVNSIYSYQVANAQLSVKGKGTVAESESPGFLTRLFNWIF